VKWHSLQVLLKKPLVLFKATTGKNYGTASPQGDFTASLTRNNADNGTAAIGHQPV
jgi:hypothetical protein